MGESYTQKHICKLFNFPTRLEYTKCGMMAATRRAKKKTDAERHDVEMQVCAFASTSRNHRGIYVRVLFIVYNTYV